MNRTSILGIDLTLRCVQLYKLHDFIFEVCLAQGTLCLDIEPLKSALFVEVMLRTAIEDYDVLFVCEGELAYSAVHVGNFLVVSPKLTLKHFEDVLFESDCL